MLRLLESKAPIADAYFADNDIIAAAAMRALRENGYRIPEDVSIIGFDDVPMCDMMVPPLSTMKVRKRELEPPLSSACLTAWPIRNANV